MFLYSSLRSWFFVGDARVNEQPNLAIIHTIFVREHNRIARVLQNLHPSWGDDRLFLEARRIVNAEYQHIIYNEFLPIVLGQDVLSKGLVPLNVGFSNDYNNNFDPRCLSVHVRLGALSLSSPVLSTEFPTSSPLLHIVLATL